MSASPRGAIRAQSTASADGILPVNVEAVYHAPLRVPVTHGDLVADLQLRAFDNENLDFYCDFIMRAGFYLGVPLTGPKPLPTRRERWTVIRAPFVHAKSKENFERHTHKRLIRAWDADAEQVSFLVSYVARHALAGVGLKCSLYQRCTVDGEGTGSSLDEFIQRATEDEPASVPESAVQSKVLELLGNPEFRKHM